mgnify:CR=1 FL=1
MKDEIKIEIKILLQRFGFIVICIAIVIILAKYIFSKGNLILGAKDIFDISLQSIDISTIFIVFYITYLWKYDPFVKIPKLNKEYHGKIQYDHKKGKGEKNVEIKIYQTLLTVKIKMESNEMKSVSLYGDIILENGDYYLYYIYRTSPLAKYSDNNPIQIGACRMDLEKVDNITGVYWSNRGTKGDIFWSKTK